MGRTLADVEACARAVADAQPWRRDPTCVPMPWRPAAAMLQQQPLRIAVMWHDGMVRPTAPVRRALGEVARRLAAAGVQVVEWDPVDQAEGRRLLGRVVMADGGVTIGNQLKRAGESWRPEMKAFEMVKELGTAELWKLQQEVSDFQNRYHDRWDKAGIDAILCPTIPFNTVENGKFQPCE
jgi:amidase